VKYAGTDKYVLGPQMRIGKKRLRAHVCSWQHLTDMPKLHRNVRYRWMNGPDSSMIAGQTNLFVRQPAYPARAARRSDCGGWPKARMKARRIRSGSRKPVDCATRSIASLEDCTRSRATSIRSRSTAFDGVVPGRAHIPTDGQDGFRTPTPKYICDRPHVVSPM
jgi:hypothetical protein